MYLNLLSFSNESRCIAAGVALVIFLALPPCAAVAESATPAGTNYDIPISELNKGQKKSTPKPVTDETKKKSKNSAKTAESQPETGVPDQPVRKSKRKPVVPVTDVKNDRVIVKTPTTPEPLQENIQIHHSPFSFVVAGKRTVIHAVISSKADIQEVSCILHTAEGGAQALVKMVKENGTRFTYTATLPALSTESTSLRYTIIVVDSLSKLTRSREFVTPVTVAPLVPSWQIEGADEVVSGKKETTENPAEPAHQ